MTGTVSAFAWHHTGISVRNLGGALNFYRTTLGFEPVFEALDMSDLIQQLTGVAGLRADLVQCKAPTGDQLLELIQFRNLPSEFDEGLPLSPGRCHNAYLVPDLDSAVEAVVRAGGNVFGSITAFSEGRAVYCSDGSGNVIELEEVSGGGAR